MYGAYLRKSRQDISFEKKGCIDTLKRHRDILISLSRQMNVDIDIWYQEVVSADTIEERPEVKKMLLEIEKKRFKGIFVIDVDRLARGDTADQARIFKSFAFSSTKIITPNKIYDPTNEADEEFFEFGLFMSRREYKLINKRLNRGRLSSVYEGKFVASICPYGYTKEKIKNEKGYRLVPLEEEARIVKFIFSKACEKVGAQRIANLLNTMKVKPRRADVWSYSTIRDILANPTYYGMVKWNFRKTEKRLIDGVIYKSRPKHKDFLLVKGLHEALIDKETFDFVNKSKRVVHHRKNEQLQNPLAGLVHCYFCNHTLQRKSYSSMTKDFLICPRIHCKNYGSFLAEVEESLIFSLKEYFSQYKITFDPSILTPVDYTPIVNTIKKELDLLERQLSNIYDLLEQNVYDTNTFYERMSLLKNRKDELEKEKKNYIYPTIHKKRIFSPSLIAILNDYHLLCIEDKNKLLRALIHKVYYKKTKKGKNHENEFTLKIILNI